MRQRDRKSLERIAEMRFKNEAEVQRYFIPPLLELLGYKVPQEAPAEEQLEFKIAYAGRETIRLKRPDFLVRSGGRTLLVIETKSPSEKLDQPAIEQALSYARHDDIRAPLTMLANGRRVLVLETDTRHPVLDVPHERLEEVYRDLYLLLSKETLGSTLAGHLRLVRPVGRGAFGVVYEAMNMQVKRREAVKIFHFTAADREAMRRRFRQGFIAHAQLEHPNIARFYRIVEYGNELAVCMQFVDGYPIDKWIRKAKPSIRERALLLATTAEAIQVAHDRGVVHRDLKPSNILVVADPEGWRPMIVDFDTAVVLGEATITQSADRFGAYGYIDPEMLDARSHRELRDRRSDVYSLGRVLEFMLTGQHPRPGRSLRELEMLIRKALRDVGPREQNLLLEVLIPAIAERREDRTQTAAALASDLRAVFDDRARGEHNAKQYAEEVFRELDRLVAEQQLPVEWQNLTADLRTNQIGRYTPIPRFDELNVLYDEALYTYYIGPVIEDERTFAQFRRSRQLRELRREFGTALRIDPITVEEDGSATLVVRHFDIVRKQSPRETAMQFAVDLRRFLAILKPPAGNAARGRKPVPPRDVVGEFDIWPSRSFGARSAFKKLAKSIRSRSPADLPPALMPFLHLLWPDARLTPDLVASGVDIAVGSPVEVAIHCSSGDVASTVAAVESFRATFQLVRDFIIIVNREEETVAVRDAVAPLLAGLTADGTAQHAVVWNHSDHVIYAAFEMMLQRMRRAIERWNLAMLEDQASVERTLGPSPVRRVPLSRYRMRIDAVGLWKQSSPASHEIGDVAEALAHDDARLLHVVLGTAGFGKTTAVMRAARERALQWLVIPAARIPPDAANAQSLFETAIDVEVLLEGALESERAIWQSIAGPVLKYLTQFRSGVGIIVDALDEATVIGKSYGLQTFFNFFRHVQVPSVITMRREFWESRQSDFAAGKSGRESTVQTLEVLELLPWTDEQIIEAARLRMSEVRHSEVRARIETFIGAVHSGEYHHYYGDIPRTPLFLRFILDVLERRDPRNANRRELFQYWAEQKIGRDFDMPSKAGGARLPIRRDVTTAEETIAVSFRAMTEAAVCMTEVEAGAVTLLPDCTFEEVRQAMGSLAPDSAESLVMNSLLITQAGHEQRLRFAHRVFQEFFLAQAMERFRGLRLPDSVTEWTGN